MTERFKLGKLDATRPYGVSDLAVYATGKLPAPPTSCDYYSGVSLPIDGNDKYGDCVMAGTAHMLAAWNREVDENVHVPDADEVVRIYFELTGGADSGLSESGTLSTWRRKGLFHDSIAGYAPVDQTDVIAASQSTAFYGATMYGIQVPESAQDQFKAGEAWTYEPDSPIEGGHCVIELGYDPLYRYWATWGGVARVTHGFVAAYADEAYAVISEAFVQARRGPSLDLVSLQADLSRLAA